MIYVCKCPFWGVGVGKPVPLDGNRQAWRRKPDRMDPEGIRPNPIRTESMDIIVNMFLCAY
mgnify:CR=1 FL=1